MNNMQDIEHKTAAFIKQHNLLPANCNVLLAVSGGADSVALLYILNKLIPNAIHIGHINHQLRGSDSLKDQEFVKSLAKKLNLPVTIESIDVKTYAKENKLSTETAARKLRLDVLSRIADKNNCRFIATAHHKNDNAETVIHRILRGTGFKGLTGIRPMTTINGKKFIRPLLCLSRRQIEEYLKSQNIPWQTDHTNIDCRFTRNRIRHQLLPYLEESTPNLVEIVSSLSQHSAILTDNIETCARTAVQTCLISKDNTQTTLDLNKFLNQPQPVQVELIQTVLTQLGCGLQKFTFEHYQKIIDFAKTSQSGKTLTMPGKIKITKGYDKFFITAPSQKTDNVQKEIVLSIPGKSSFANWQIETEILPIDSLDIKTVKNNTNDFVQWFDFQQIKPPLVARFRHQGDRFKPFGLEKSKKIGKFLTSEKIDLNSRKKAFLISDSEKILWLVPVRRSSEAAITDKSRTLLQIKAKKTFINTVQRFFRR
ncbi:MAG: tRNA lysidine(34) synthetase TilS [Planctomycetes bacterium]|nr:tRNA lysidine(34) synthetase TilS [Planctomycetota bacterium]